MSRIKYLRNLKLNEITLKRLYAALLRRIIDFPHNIAWCIPTSFNKQNLENILTFKNKHKGERCFIIANGPSLKDIDFSLLQNEYTIGMNRIYKNKKIMGFLPTYIVIYDVLIQLRQFAQEIQAVDTIKFLNWNGHKYFSNYNNSFFFRQSFRKEFTTDFPHKVHGGHSVTNVCLQLAYFLGFKEVILIGKDHYYAQKGIPGQLIISSGDENNHFMKGYYKKGMLWRMPDYKGEELMYGLAKDAFERDGRKVLDATVNGKLKIFEKINYYSLF